MSQIYFEDVSEGQELPVLVQNCDSQRLVMWAGAYGDFYQIHYDKDFAQSTGLPDRIAHGTLKHALLGRMLHEWAGEKGRVRRLACQYRGMDMVNKDVICKGMVTGKKSENGAHLVELDVWTEDPEGNRTTPGTALVELPARTAG